MFFVFQNLLARLQPRRSAQAPAASRSAVPGTDTASISLMDVRLASLGIVLDRLDQHPNHGGRP